MKTLKDLQVGEQARVLRLTGVGAVRRRIMDMGVTKGVTLSVVKTAPMGDPIEIRLRDTAISLRREDCGRIEVE